MKKGTRDGYKSAQQQYEYYVHDYFPGTNPWPATETLICAFAAHRLEGLGPYARLKGTTLEGYISGLRSYHVDHMLPVSVFTSGTFKRIVKGSYEIYGRAKRPRFPITHEILSRITEDKPQSINDLNLHAAYLLSFAAFLRIGEITYNSNDEPGSEWFHETKVTRSCVTFSANNDHIVLHFKRSKIDIRNEGVSIVVPAIDSLLCPVKAPSAFGQQTHNHTAPSSSASLASHLQKTVCNKA